MEIQELLKKTKKQMEYQVDILRKNLQKIDVYKISPGVLDGIKVNYFGTPTPINQIAKIVPKEAGVLWVEPWEKSLLSTLEKVITTQKKSYNVRQNKNGAILISIPPQTKERRQNIVKELHETVEKSIVAIRTERISVKKQLKPLEKEGISKDLIKDAEEELQKITQQQIQEVEHISKIKESQILND